MLRTLSTLATVASRPVLRTPHVNTNVIRCLAPFHTRTIIFNAIKTPTAPTPLSPKTANTSSAHSSNPASTTAATADNGAPHLTPIEELRAEAEADRQAALKFEYDPETEPWVNPLAVEMAKQRDPRLPKTPAEIEAEQNSGETCDSWPWDNRHDLGLGANKDLTATIEALAKLPYPKPLLPVYRHASYRPSTELITRQQRLYHVFTCLLTFAVGWYVIIASDFTAREDLKKQLNDPSTPMAKIYKFRAYVHHLFRDPRTEYQTWKKQTQQQQPSSSSTSASTTISNVNARVAQ